MRKRLLFIFLICAAAEALPQSGDARLDSIFNIYASSHGSSLEGALPSVTAQVVSGEPVKCGLPLSAELQANYDALSSEQKKLLSKILFAPSLHTFVISPSGIFKVHYDTLGANAPNYNSALTVHANAVLAAEAFDSSYAYEVGYLGYPPPPMEGVYDVYIENVDNQFYGETVTYKRYTPTTSYTYIRIDNDYVSTYTKGVVALKATAAHELHHSIELGNYTSVFDDADIFFFELTATSMEEFVFDDCNDYYNYLASYFYNSDRNFTKNTGYNLCIWNIYLRQKYGETGFGIIKKQWDEMAKGKRAMDAIQESLLDASSSFQKEYAEFSVWNYFTKHRAIAGRYYEEGAKYPLIKPTHVTATLPYSVTISLNPLSANYFYFDTRRDLANDTLAAIITNSDITKGIGSGEATSVTYSLSNYDYDGVDLKVSSSLNAEGAAYWTVSYIYNNTPYIPEILDERSIDYAFPNPFKYSYSARGTEISIPIKNKKLDKANLNIYSVSGNLVYNGSKQINSFGGTFIIKWNGLNNDNEKLPEGIYFYAAECDGDIYKGKIAIFNE